MIVDALIVAFVGALAWRGWRRGVIPAVIGLAGFVAAITAAVLGYRILAPVLRTLLRLSDAAASFAAAAIIFIGVSAAFLVLGRVVSRMVRATTWGAFDRVAGASLGGVWAVSWVTLVLLAISVIPAPAAVRSGVRDSALAREIIRDAPGVARSMARADLRKVLEIFVPSELRLSVHATKEFRAVPEDERYLFGLVNRERIRRGLGALVWDDSLAAAARAHAGDMYSRGYFEHDSPEGRTPADRLRRLGIRFRVTAENIALAPEVDHAHQRMMRSAVHRRHILASAYTRVGVGIMFGPQGVMVDEEFAG